MTDEKKEWEKAQSWEEFFSNFTYKPNWHFNYQYAIDTNSHRVVMAMRVPDSRGDNSVEGRNYHPRRLVQVTRNVDLPRWEEEAFHLSLIRFHIWALETHEMDEWMQYKGVIINDPHQEY